MTNGTYAFTGSVAVVTVATSGTYDLTAYGAEGGGGNAAGGMGAKIGGEFVLTQGDIVVGGQGAPRDLS